MTSQTLCRETPKLSAIWRRLWPFWSMRRITAPVGPGDWWWGQTPIRSQCLHVVFMPPFYVKTGWTAIPSDRSVFSILLSRPP